MNSDKRTARYAGCMYLLVVITGMFSLAYIPQKLIDWNNASVTFNNISASNALFRLGIYSSVICYIAFTFLPLLLYKLLRKVHESIAGTMVILAILSVPVSFNNLQHLYTALALTEKVSLLHNGSITDMQNQMMFSLHQFNDGLLLATVFWGLWLFPFGWLVYKSGFITKILGILLMLGCIGYLVNFTGNTVLENYAKTGVGNYFRILPAVAEIGTCIWLLVVGIKKNKNAK